MVVAAAVPGITSGSATTFNAGNIGGDGLAVIITFFDDAQDVGGALYPWHQSLTRVCFSPNQKPRLVFASGYYNFSGVFVVDAPRTNPELSPPILGSNREQER